MSLSDKAVAGLQRAVEGVLDLHSKRSFDGDGYGWVVCAECRQTYPCKTVEVVLGAEAKDRGV